jgi:hypothetical protein
VILSTVALAAERGELAPAPVGLITGTTYQWGTRPPFRPAAVIEAIRQVLTRPRTTSEQITAIVGPPDFMTGCSVTGDLAGLADGRPVDLRLHARVTITDGAQLSARIDGNTRGSWFTPGQLNPTVLLIANFPPQHRPVRGRPGHRQPGTPAAMGCRLPGGAQSIGVDVALTDSN